MLSHECVYDKRQSAPLAFARLFPLAGQTERVQQDIREFRWPATFLVPSHDGLLDEDMYIDFRFILSVDASLLITFRKIASLTVDSRAALREQLTRFWTRAELLL